METLTPAEKFARNFYLEKNTILNYCFDENSETYVASKIKELGLDDDKQKILKEAISQLLTDSFYTILLGIDGATSIGDSNQEVYSIVDENGNQISECGDLEAAAYSYFYDNKIEEE